MPGDKKLRTMYLTYEADDAVAETLVVVLGAVAENFRGVEVVEIQDDTLFAEGVDAREVLHELVTSDGRLTPEQRSAIAAFGQAVAEWDGTEQP